MSSLLLKHTSCGVRETQPERDILGSAEPAQLKLRSPPSTAKLLCQAQSTPYPGSQAGLGDIELQFPEVWHRPNKVQNPHYGHSCATRHYEVCLEWCTNMNLHTDTILKTKIKRTVLFHYSSRTWSKPLLEMLS